MIFSYFSWTDPCAVQLGLTLSTSRYGQSGTYHLEVVKEMSERNSALYPAVMEGDVRSGVWQIPVEGVERPHSYAESTQ